VFSLRVPHALWPHPQKLMGWEEASCMN
jgi:hypothetical protein